MIMANLLIYGVFFLELLIQISSQTPVPRPNIIFILTDDQDITLLGMESMAQTKKLIVDQGLTFTNGFVSTPICCVSRSSIMSGRYVHNHHVTNNSLAGGCSNTTWQTQIEPYNFPAILKTKYNYLNFYSGKYLNAYGTNKAGGVKHIPAGFTHWYGLVGNSKYYNYSISNNGKEEKHKDNYYNDYYTDLIHNQSIKFIHNHGQNNSFMMILGTPAAHGPFTPAPQYNTLYANESAPRIPNFNDASSLKDKHDLLRLYTHHMDDKLTSQADEYWRMRHRTLKSVDDMIHNIYNKIKSMGLENRTYWFFTGDNGFHSGQFCMAWDKRQLYENDIRVPYYWFGPGIPSGYSTDIIGLNIDIGPTIISLVSGNDNNIPDYIDGKSLTNVLFNSKYHYKNGNNKQRIKTQQTYTQQFLIEYYGSRNESMFSNGVVYGKPITYDVNITNQETTTSDSWNNTYDCIRMIDNKNGEINGTIYCQFKCYQPDTKLQVSCNMSTPQGYGEYYQLDNDYYELSNTILQLNNSQTQQYKTLMNSFLSCSGQTECNSLRQT